MNDNRTVTISECDAIEIMKKLISNGVPDYISNVNISGITHQSLDSFLYAAIKNDDAAFFDRALSLGYPGLFPQVKTVLSSCGFQVEAIADIHDQVFKDGAVNIFQLLRSRGAFDRDDDYLEYSAIVALGLRNHLREMAFEMDTSKQDDMQFRKSKDLFEITTSRGVSFNDEITHLPNIFETEKGKCSTLADCVVEFAPSLFKVMMTNCYGDINEPYQRIINNGGGISATVETTRLEAILRKCQQENYNPNNNNTRDKEYFEAVRDMMVTAINFGATLPPEKEQYIVKKLLSGTGWELTYRNAVAAKKLNDKAAIVTPINTPVKGIKL